MGTRAHEIQPTQDISTLNAFLTSFFVCSLKLVDFNESIPDCSTVINGRKQREVHSHELLWSKNEFPSTGTGPQSLSHSPQSTVHSPQSTVHSPQSICTYSTHCGIAPGGICRRHSNRSITSACLGTLNSQWFCSGGNLFAVWLAPLRRRDFFSIFKLDGGNWLLQANACILERRVSKMFTSQAEI